MPELQKIKGKLDPSKPSNWIKKLDNELLKTGISPKVAFLNADKNQNGVCTLEELRESLKNLLPEEDMSLAELKQIVRSFDINNNGLIEEDEFIR